MTFRDHGVSYSNSPGVPDVVVAKLEATEGAVIVKQRSLDQSRNELGSLSRDETNSGQGLIREGKPIEFTRG